MVGQWRVDGQRRVDPPRQQQQNFLQKSCPLFSPLHHNINQNIFSFSPLWFHLKYSAAAGAALPPHALPLTLRPSEKFLSKIFDPNREIREAVKQHVAYGQADHKGREGGRSPLLA